MAAERGPPSRGVRQQRHVELKHPQQQCQPQLRRGSADRSISATSFTRDFSAMGQLKPITAKGKGKVAVILPDTVSSARYTEFDAPYLTKALLAAGLPSSQFTVQNAQGSDATELSRRPG